MARLVMQLPGGRFREHELERMTRIGRQPDQDLQVLDPLVSKAHLVVEQIADAWYLRDLESRNGTWVNNERVQGRVRLNHDDRIKIGSTHIVFTARPDRKGATGPLTRSGGLRTESTDLPVHRETFEDFLPIDLVPDEATLKRDYEKLRLAHRLHREVAFDLKIDLVLPRILEHLFALFRADRGVIMLVGADGALVPRAMAGQGRDSDEEPIQLSQTIVNTVLEKRTAMLTRDAQIDRRFQHAQSVIMQGIRSSMCAPLLGRSRDVIGIIHLDSLLAANAFTERDLSMFLAIASEAAIAIENAHLLERHEGRATEREGLRRFLPPQVVTRAMSGEVQVPRELCATEVVALHLALRQATGRFPLPTVPATAPDLASVAAQNGLLDGLVRVVFEHGGTLVELGLDGLMAVWGAPLGTASARSDALSCALALLQAAEPSQRPGALGALLASGGTAPVDLGDLGVQTMLAAGLQQYELRVGLDRGPAWVGMVAPGTAAAYSASGPAVELSRLLAAQAAPGDILVSSALAAGPAAGPVGGPADGVFEPNPLELGEGRLDAWRFVPAPGFSADVRRSREETLHPGEAAAEAQPVTDTPSGRSSGDAPGSSGRSSGDAPGSSGRSSGYAPGSSGRSSGSAPVSSGRVSAQEPGELGEAEAHEATLPGRPSDVEQTLDRVALVAEELGPDLSGRSAEGFPFDG